VTAIPLLCLVLLCTPVQLDCSLVALQANFEDPFLEPPTGLASFWDAIQIGALVLLDYHNEG
jgi:hypothetical protein